MIKWVHPPRGGQAVKLSASGRTRCQYRLSSLPHEVVRGGSPRNGRPHPSVMHVFVGESERVR